MLHTLHEMLAPAVMERLTLLLNHVIGAEAVARQRLQPHAGKAVLVQATGWPSLLPPLPRLAWRITPAGLLEWCGTAPPDSGPDRGPDNPELRLSVAVDNPALVAARLLAGDRPAVDVAGDAQLAGDVNWLMENLRWDIGADLERVFPVPVAAGLQQAGTVLAQGLHRAVQGLDAVRQRWPGRQGA